MGISASMPILAAAIVIAGALMFLGRWEIVAAGIIAQNSGTLPTLRIRDDTHQKKSAMAVRTSSVTANLLGLTIRCVKCGVMPFS
jgi:hypothetical protein